MCPDCHKWRAFFAYLQCVLDLEENILELEDRFWNSGFVSRTLGSFSEFSGVFEKPSVYSGILGHISELWGPAGVLGWLPIIHLLGLVLSAVICQNTWLQGGSCYGNSNHGVYQLPEFTLSL